ncbi:TonB-dependent siderophore receptor [Shewanella sp. NIFS-20-20]|uniref:TonB-dependent receptor plug domain-containing protein n=1 Tax=Shewanella sp. NIFS-20-20 TaxID=2853806 RepID=UPI001C446B5A|nr:TonB-dependent receptor [Shewanella sp. NIFS-20-20]MBV7315155.1 TonB-dependent receptor [Shewanella sp. NIFS-20-20]
MSTQTAVSKAVRLSLFALVSSSAATIAHAETEQVGANVERIEVTGSRIQRTDMETSSPVTVISKAEIDASGVATVSDFVRNLSQNSFGSFRDASGFGAGQSSQSTVSMRGLGPQRTLILIDGRRMGSSVAFGGGTQNLNVVPMAAVERIEVLRDGASAVYGSDAVAGVINIITKKEYEGVEIDAEQGITQHGGAENTSVRMTFGAVTDSTNIVASVEYFNRSPLYDSDRDFSSEMLSSYGWPGTGSYVDKSKPKLDKDGKPVLGADGTPQYETVSFADARCDGSENSQLITDSKGNTVCGYNAAADSATMAAQERFSTFVKVDHAITDDINWTNRLMMTRVWTEGQYAGAPNSNSPTLKHTDANSDIYMATIDKYGSQWLKDQVAAGNYVDIDLKMRTTPLGPRITKVQDSDINFLTALDGYADLLGGMTWGVGAQWIRSDVSSVQSGAANATVIQELLDGGKLDYFAAGSGYVDGSNEAAIQAAGHTALFNGRVQTYGVDGGFSIDLFDIPNGTIPLAIGFEWNRTEYEKIYDLASNQGNIVGSSGGDIITGKSREVWSISAETIIPVLDNLDVELSARFDDYSDFGNTFNPKAGISYRPFDSLLLRASYGTGFRAPTFDDLYTGQSETFLWASDWASCPSPTDCAREQYKAFYQGNEELEPEESTSLSMGMVWNITDELDFELSYYDIQIDNVISTLSSQDVFNLERDGFDVSEMLFRDANGEVERLLLQKLNLGELKTRGIDFNLRYLLATQVGDFNFGAETNYVLSWEAKDGPNSPMEDIVGETDQPQFRINLSSTWTHNEWEASLFARYTAEQEDADYGTTDGQWIVDTQVGYYLPWNGKINFGIRNLLDEEPPFNYELGFPFYSTSLYDPIGREYYLRYNQKF